MKKFFLFSLLISSFTLGTMNGAAYGAETIESKINITNEEVNKMGYIIEFYSKDISEPTLILDPEKQNIYYIGSGGIYYEFKENTNFRKIIQYLPQYEFKKFTDDINEVINKIKETGEVVVFYGNEIDFWRPVFDKIVVKEK